VEAGREAVRKELENVQRKMASVEDECQKKNRENLTALEQQVRVEQQAAEQRRHLETALEAARAQLADMRVELEAAHGRVEALETQLTKTEALRRDVELKLSSVVSTLRRTVGIFHGDSVVDKTRSRSASPRKGQRSVNITKKNVWFVSRRSYILRLKSFQSQILHFRVYNQLKLLEADTNRSLPIPEMQGGRLANRKWKYFKPRGTQT